MTGLPLPHIDGVRIQEAGPIDDLFLPLTTGLTVLYGKNGAGKTRILSAIADAAGNVADTDISGRRRLIFTWLPDEVRPEDFSSYFFSEGAGADPEPKRWLRLRGNPWVGRTQADLADLADPWASRIDSDRGLSEVQDYVTAVTDRIGQFGDVPLLVGHLARDVVLQGSRVETLRTDEALTLNVGAAIDIARQGRFRSVEAAALARSTFTLSSLPRHPQRQLCCGNCAKRTNPTLIQPIRPRIGSIMASTAIWACCCRMSSSIR